ncbi:IS3 family transposase [Streptomyces sp. NBC_00390]|uniref:IS3 family transposase n=1 Tax=Streptomyces sp. NBC_00390 TaxID=2975736 RepID=UPI002E1AD0D9
MSAVYAFIEAEKTTHNVALLCRLLKVARSSFYAWLAGGQARAARRAADDALAHEITVLHIASRCTYGVPRIHAELRRLDRRVNRKRVERIMRERDIAGVTRRKRRSLTRPANRAVPAADLIGRDFTADAPGRKLVGAVGRLALEPVVTVGPGNRGRVGPHEGATLYGCWPRLGCLSELAGPARRIGGRDHRLYCWMA